MRHVNRFDRIAVVLLVLSGAHLGEANDIPPLENVTVSCVPVKEIAPYYANFPILCDFSIVNEGTVEIGLPITNPFDDLAGFYADAFDPAGTPIELTDGWHGVVSWAPASAILLQRLRLRPGERVTWREYLPHQGLGPGKKIGLDAGTYRITVYLYDFVREQKIYADPIDLVILPPPAGEEEARAALRSGVQQPHELMAQIERFPDSIYVPYYLNYVARGSEVMPLSASCDQTGMGGYCMEFAERSLRCREILRRDHPGWPLNAEGMVHEAALRVRLDQPGKAVDLLETAIREYPGSVTAHDAAGVLPAVRNYRQGKLEGLAQAADPVFPDPEFRKREARQSVVEKFPVCGNPRRSRVR